MKVSEAIEKLTIKRDDALHFQKLYRAGDVGWSANESKAIAFNIAINTLEQIDEPQAEKVEVKRCVAEFYEANKDDLNFAIYEAVAHSIKECGYKAYPEGFMDWLVQSSNNPFETLIRMKDGYTVKPKRWVVKNEEGRYFVAFSKYAKTPFEGVFSASVTDLVTFDDKAKAEAVATLVDGSVEEV